MKKFIFLFVVIALLVMGAGSTVRLHVPYFWFNDTDHSPSTAGQFLYDNNVTGIEDGAFAFYDDDAVRYFVDLDTLPVDDDYVVAYDAVNDEFYMKADAGSAGGDSISVDGIGVVDPDFVSTGDIDFVDTANTITADINADKIVESQLKSSNAPTDNYVLTYNQATGGFTWAADQTGGGDPVLVNTTAIADASGVDLTDGTGITITLNAGASPDTATFAATLGTSIAAGEIADSDHGDFTYSSGTATLDAGVVDDAALNSTEWLDLDIKSAKLTGTFVTQGDATQGAAIDAGDGNWRLLFDDTVDEGAVWQFRMPSTYSSGLTAKIIYSMSSGTTNEVEFEVFVMAVSDGDAADVGTASFDTVNAGSATVPATAGYIDAISITLTNADSVAAGDIVFINLSTDSDDATNDDATGDREVIGLTLEWTR